MNWNDITVEHYQTIYPYIQDESMTEIDRDIKILTVLTGKTEEELDRMPMKDFLSLRNGLKFLHCEQVDVSPVTVLKTKNRRYKINYDVRRMPVARYVEIKHFAGSQGEVIKNLHLIMASMVVPLRRAWWGGWIRDKYLAHDHSRYADDILTAPFRDVFYTMVFFYNLYNNWIRSSRDYLENLLVKRGVSRRTARLWVADLCSVLDGFITSSKLPTITA